MATFGSDPQWPKFSPLQRTSSGSRSGAQSILSRSERQTWSSFPMGQRPKITYRDSSSYLLQELIHRCQESEADLEGYQDKEDELEGEDEVESEESSESEMLNLEVCFPHPDLLPPDSFLRPWGPATSVAASRCTVISPWLSPFLGLSPSLFFPFLLPRFLTPC